MPAGTLASSGYYEVQIQGRKKQAHRVVWELHNGPIPPGKCIDRINRVRTDNRIENLRLASVSDNNCNSTRPTQELPRGIYHNGKAYRAEFWKDGKRFMKKHEEVQLLRGYMQVHTRESPRVAQVLHSRAGVYLKPKIIIFTRGPPSP